MSSTTHQWVILIGILVIISLPVLLPELSFASIISKGDLVEVEYTISLFDGSIYATTNSELAKQNNVSIFVHDSFKYIVGDNNPYPLDIVVLGMKQGQKTTKKYTPTTLPSTQTVVRTKDVDRILSVPQKPTLPFPLFSQLFGTATVNDEVSNPEYFPWSYKILNRTDKGMKVEALAVPKTTYQLPGQPWTAYLTDITGGMMYFRQDAQIGQHLTTYLGDTEVINVSEKHITVKRNPVTDSIIETAQGTYYVINFTDQDIFIRPARTFIEETNFTIDLEVISVQQKMEKK